MGNIQPAKPRVLLVDDTPGNLVALEAVLDSIGAELVEAKSGQEAVDLVARNWFAAIVLDVQMPLMDGFEAAARIRHLEKGREVPIIFLTAVHREPTYVVRGYEAGATDYMTKPLDVGVLRARVKAFVDLFRQREGERRHRLESALDSAPAFVSIVSVPGYVCDFANARFRRLFRGREIIGRSVTSLGATSEMVALLDRVVASGESVAVDEYVLTLPDHPSGSDSRLLNLTLQPLRDAQDRLEGILSFAIDVTEQVDARMALEQAREKAEAANRAKDEFLAMVSHELRSPLNAILGWTAIARRKNTSPDVEHALGVIVRNAIAQNQLVETLLDVSRGIGGNLRLAIAPTKLGETLEQVIESLRPAAEGKAIALGARPTDLGVIHADADRLQQVFWNVLSNAIKFTGEGGHVDVSAVRDRARVTIQIADSGDGVDPEFLPHLFEPFRQADASTTRRNGGLGLGLAIVRQIVHAHGGSVAAASAGKGQGTSITIEVPVRSMPSPTPPPMPALKKSTFERGVPPLRLDDLRLLVVDDDEDARMLMSEVFAECGATVTTAASAQEALAQLRSGRPDVLISDIGMPDIDGYMLIEEIRRLPQREGGKTPAIALTAYSRSDDVTRALNAGYQLHAKKPIEPTKLVASVATLAGRQTTA